MGIFKDKVCLANSPAKILVVLGHKFSDRLANLESIVSEFSIRLKNPPGYLLTLCLGIFCLNSDRPILAQVIEDGTTSTAVSAENSQDYTVNLGDRVGNNLFHSFTEFSLANGGSVFFNNSTAIANIFSRVTGSNLSNINGSISNNGTANLFLLNPNGIIFGENASLNLGGSFIATTAESLVFEDGTEFGTDLGQQPLLTVSVPLGLQFGSSSGSIVNLANLSIANPQDPTGSNRLKLGLNLAPNNTLALLSNSITFEGGAVTSPGGNIALGSVAESFVPIKPVAQGWEFDFAGVDRFSNIELNNLASVDASGAGGGKIDIWSNNLQILDGSAITSHTLGNFNGRGIQVNAADSVQLDGSDLTGTKLDSFLASNGLFFPQPSQIASHTFGVGNAGNIEITANNLQLTDGGAIELQTFPGSSGLGGNLSIAAGNLVSLSGVRPFLGTAEGTVLPIDFDTAIDFNQASEIGAISISDADGGNVNITAGNILLADGAAIGTSPFGSGNGGDINLNVTDTVEVAGVSPRTGSTSSVIGANTFIGGNLGNINIQADNLVVRGGGRVLSVTSSQNNAGQIRLDTNVTEITGIAEVSQTPSLISTEAIGGGDGGTILLNTDSLQISDRASLSVRGSGTSIPGNLVVNARAIELDNIGSITASTEFQSGGNISLNLEDNLVLTDGSFVSARAFNNAAGGNVEIDADFIIAFPQQNNDILANAVFGMGGNININANGLFGLETRNSVPVNLSNDLDASSEFGLAGTVATSFPELSSTQGFFRLPAEIVDVSALFSNSFCKLSQQSRFITTGRGGIPLAPEQNLLSEHTWSDWRIVEEAGEKEDGEHVPADPPQQIALIQGWVTNKDGDVVLTDKPLETNHNRPLKSPDCDRLRNQSK